MLILFAALSVLLGVFFLFYLKNLDFYGELEARKFFIATLIGVLVAGFFEFGLGKVYNLINLLPAFEQYGFSVLVFVVSDIVKLLFFGLFLKAFRISAKNLFVLFVYVCCVCVGYFSAGLFMDIVYRNFVYSMNSSYLLSPISSFLLMSIVFIYYDKKTYLRVVGIAIRFSRRSLSVDLLVFLCSIFFASYLAYVRNFYALNFLLLSFFMRSRKLIGYAQLISPCRAEVLDRFLQNDTLGKNRLCLSCNQVSDHKLYEIANYKVEECLSCKEIVLPESKARGFLRLFLPFPIDEFDGSFFKSERYEKLGSCFRPFVDAQYNHCRKINIRELRVATEDLAQSLQDKSIGLVRF